MIEAVVMMGGLGIIVGAGLAAASKIFYVYVDRSERPWKTSIRRARRPRRV